MSVEKHIELAFDEAIELKNAGKIEECLDRLNALSRQYPGQAALSGTLAGIYFESGNYEKAAAFFEETVKLSAASSTASLGLFHSLLELGRIGDALMEIERFIVIERLAEYREIVSELHEKRGEDEFAEFAGVISKLADSFRD